METNPKKSPDILEIILLQNTSLRRRITVAILSIAILAVAVVGPVTNIRNLEAQTLLGDQFQKTVQNSAESQILSIAQLQAQEIENFVKAVDNSIITTAKYAESLLDGNITRFTNDRHWNATQRLSPTWAKAWDNPNREVVSVFAPDFFAFTPESINEMNSLIFLNLLVPDMMAKNEHILALYYGSQHEYVLYYPNIDLANIVPADFKVTGRPWYLNAANSLYGSTRTTWSDPYFDAALNGLVVTSSLPVFDETGALRGVVGADVQLVTLVEQVSGISVGETGYAFLLDINSNILAMPEQGFIDFDLPQALNGEENQLLSMLDYGPEHLQPIINGMSRGTTGLARIQLHNTQYYMAFAPVPSTGYSLAILVPTAEMDAAFLATKQLVDTENQATRTFGIVLLLLVIGASVAVSAGISRLLVNPLQSLTQVAQNISNGDLLAKAQQSNVAEFNVLADAFNLMTTRLRETLGGLEIRIAERTQDLETANNYNKRRAFQFEAIAQVARNISTSQDIETLLPRITYVISQQFGYYHTGIFLLDKDKEFAVLRAANSEGGQRMLARNHKLRIGETGIVGFVTRQGKARVALDTGKDAVFFNNPDLPDTRSEMALPLKAGGEVIGALDVQSTEQNAFTEDDINTLAILADQVSIAIQNASLYEDNQNALASSRALYQEFIQTGWSEFRKKSDAIGIQLKDGKAHIITDRQKDLEDQKSDLSLPIQLRGETIGVLKATNPDGRKWTRDDIDIANAILERTALALENARLFETTTRRAERERTVAEVTAKIRSTNDPQAMIQTALEELQRRLGAKQVKILPNEKPAFKDDRNDQLPAKRK